MLARYAYAWEPDPVLTSDLAYLTILFPNPLLPERDVKKILSA